MARTYSQEERHSVSVLDSETGAPIENVHIYQNQSLLWLSDKKGSFNINETLLPDTTVFLSFSCVGYQKKEVNLRRLKEEDYIVRLDKETVQIKEAVVHGTQRELKRFIHFEKLSPLPRRIHSFASALYNDTLYVVGGAVTNAWRDDILLNSLYTYSLESGTWEKSGKTFNKRMGHSIQIHNNRMYIMGGMTERRNKKKRYLEKTIEVFDMNTREIAVDKTNPHEAVHFLSVLKEDHILVLGGSQKILNEWKKVNSKDIHLFDLRTGYWYKVGELGEGKEATGVLVNNKIYLVGGHSFCDLDLIESYDLETGKVTVESRMLKTAVRPAVTSDGGIIYIFDDGLIYTYNTLNRKLNAYLVDIDIVEAEMHYQDNKLYILGGKESFVKNPGAKDHEWSITEGSPHLFRIDVNEFKTTQSID